jgi:hypothetical protein
VAWATEAGPVTGVLPPSLRGRAIELPRVLSVAGARELGMSRAAVVHAMHAYGWQRLARGFVLTVPGAATRADWINVGLELAAPTGAISGWDAARIVGLGDPDPPRPEVLILTRGGEHRVIGAARIRPTRRPFRTWTLPGEHPDFPYADVVHTARAVADTALQYRRFRPVRALVTSAVQQKALEIEELICELESGPRNGSAWLRRALADALDGAKSIAEAEAIDVLRRSPVPEFEANVPIVTASGVVIAEADGLWRELRAVLEIDSRAYHLSEDDWDNTRKRHGRLGRHGLSVDHHSPKEVRGDPAGFAKEVEQRLRARAAELGIPYRPARDPLRRPAIPGKPEPFIVPDLLA